MPVLYVAYINPISFPSPISFLSSISFLNPISLISPISPISLIILHPPRTRVIKTMCAPTKGCMLCKHVLKSTLILHFSLLKSCMVSKKAIPLHPLSRTNAISQMNKMKLASILSWRAVELNERHLKQTLKQS